MAQMRLMVGSNSGGVGKSTLVGQIATRLALKNYKVSIVDLDITASQDVFLGLETANPEHSVAKVFRKDFSGDWPLVGVEGTTGLEVCQGSPDLERVVESMSNRERESYILKDALDDYPIDNDVIIFDCPGTRGFANKNALAACSHILFVLQAESKSADGFAGMLEWCGSKTTELRLSPRPKYLGALPNMVDRGTLGHKRVIAALEDVLPEMNIHLFPYVRRSKEFINASEYGLPLAKYRPGHAANADLDPVITAIEKELEGK